jgi:enoyl-CoA hydratase/carnithine racemase
VEHVLTQFSAGVLKIVLNRPEKKNAITAAMYGVLADALTQADADAAVRVITIEGAGGVFTAGNDLKDFLDNPPRSADSPPFRFLHAISHASKPVVASVAGIAVGIGTTMLLHCDFVYAMHDARFHLPFVNLGLCPEAASSYLLPAMAGYKQAAQLLLLGDPFSANEALSTGLVTALFEDEVGLAGQVNNIVAMLVAKPAASLRATKALMKQPHMAQIEQAMASEGRIFGERLASPEAKEAFTAFYEKRKPDFSRFG